ncbi:MAG: hypothetical protein JST00_14345 [Deltaproteobacteria bacterium]|nr:hypothetical protein [Deltaproteobacteria bacterium]
MAPSPLDVRARERRDAQGGARAWQWLRGVLAIVAALFACSSMATAAGPASGGLAITVDVSASVFASPASDDADGAAAGWRSGSPRPVGVPEGMAGDVDDDDDDDPTCGVVDVTALAFRHVPTPRESGAGFHVARDVDTSRFAAGARLPRGPPC